MNSRRRDRKKPLIGFLSLFFVFSSYADSYSSLRVYCNRKDIILITVKNASRGELIHKIFRKLEIENNEWVDAKPRTLYLLEAPLEEIVGKIIHAAKSNNYAIFYRIRSVDGYFITRIQFLSHENDKDEIRASRKASVPLSLNDNKSMDFWLENLSDGELKSGKESLKIMANFLDPVERPIFLDSLTSFVHDEDCVEGEGKNFDIEMVKNIAKDMLQEFLTGNPKPTYGR